MLKFSIFLKKRIAISHTYCGFCLEIDETRLNECRAQSIKANSPVRCKPIDLTVAVATSKPPKDSNFILLSDTQLNNSKKNQYLVENPS